MKKFEYKLEKVLNIKKRIEEQNKIDYKNANNYLLDEKDKLDNLNRNYNGYQKQLKKALSSKIIFSDITYYENALKYIEIKIIEQEEVVKKAEELLESIRLQLIESIKERKTFEILKEKEYIEYKKELEKEERKEIDEFIAFKYTNAINNN